MVIVEWTARKLPEAKRKKIWIFRDTRCSHEISNLFRSPRDAFNDAAAAVAYS